MAKPNPGLFPAQALRLCNHPPCSVSSWEWPLGRADSEFLPCAAIKPRTSSMARSLCVSSDTISNPAKTDVHPWLHRPEQASTRIASPQEPQNTTPQGRAMATARSENARAGCGSARLLHFEVPTSDLIMEDDVISPCLRASPFSHVYGTFAEDDADEVRYPPMGCKHRQLLIVACSHHRANRPGDIRQNPHRDLGLGGHQEGVVVPYMVQQLGPLRSGATTTVA